MRGPALLRATILAAFPLLAAGIATAGDVVGSVRVSLPGVRVADSGPVVVYLERPGGATGPPGAEARVEQRYARFRPSFLVVTVGQTVEMSNDDTIYHNVFSYSRPNGFDLGLYPGGESRRVTFRHPGVVRTYCSIHENMNGTIFVAPTPFFAQPGDDGRFRLAGVPEGRWRLRTWAERLPAFEKTITVPHEGTSRVEIVLGAPSVGAQSNTAPERKRSVSPTGTAALTR